MNSITHQSSPTQAIEAEQSVLSWIMNDRDAVAIPHLIQEGFKPEHFSAYPHQLIYEAAVELFNVGRGSDIISLTYKLTELGSIDTIGGKPYLIQLSGLFLYAGHSKEHVKPIVDAYVKRGLGHVASMLKQGELNPTAISEDVIVKATEALSALSLTRANSKPISLAEAIQREAANIQFLIDNEDVPSPVVPTGFRDLDAILGGGYERGALVILGGRPGTGKTALALRSMDSQFRGGFPVMFFSYEMMLPALAQRMIGARLSERKDHPKVSSRMVKTARSLQSHDVREIQAWAESTKYELAPENFMRIVHDKQTTVDILKAQARSYHRECLRRGLPGLGVIYVDHLGWVPEIRACEEDSARRSVVIGSVALSLIEIAQELNCAVVALSQLNRASESRGDKRPQASDLSGSDHLVHHAATIALIHDTLDPKNPEQNPCDAKFWIIIDKSREGARGDVELVRDRSCGIFSDVIQTPPPYIAYESEY